MCWWMKLKKQDEETVQPHEAARQPNCWEVSVIQATDHCEVCIKKSGVSPCVRVLACAQAKVNSLLKAGLNVMLSSSDEKKHDFTAGTLVFVVKPQ